MQAKAATGTPSGYVLFKPVKITSTTGTGKKKKTKTTTTCASSRRTAARRPTLHRDPTTGNAGLLDSHGGKVPAGWKVLKVPAKTIVVTCSSKSSTRLPGRRERPAVRDENDYYLFKHGAYPSDRYATNGQYPNMTGKELKLSGIRQDFDPTTNQPIVLLPFNGQGQQDVPAGDEERGDALQDPVERGAANCGAPARSRSSSTTRSGRGPRSTRRRTRTASTRAARGAEINNIGSAQRGEEPRARPADRRAADHVRDRSSAPTSRRRSARTR